MGTPPRAQIVFHLTGRRADGEEPGSGLSGLRPALLAPYRRLDTLRHDFPVVLSDAGGTQVLSLCEVVDTALRTVAQHGVPGEAMRRRVLGIERRIRELVAGGARGRLTELWERAAEAQATQGDEAFLRDVRRARDALPWDGEVAGFDAALPARFLRHAWAAMQREKLRTAGERIGRLVIRLGDILRADHARSAAALRTPALQATFGGAHHGLFDFDAMSRLLSRGGARGGLSERRRARVEEARAVLLAQRFFPGTGPASGGGAYGFEFDGTGPALEAFRERLPEVANLLKALLVAELEVEGSYVEDVHDAVVASFDARSVTAQDLEFFPDYLVCLAGSDAGSHTGLAQALSSGVPLKVVVQVADLLEEAALGQGSFTFGLRAAQVASAAMSLDDVFVLQSAASNLLRLRPRIECGLRFKGPALFSIYAPPDGVGLPGYLQAAAAMQSRAFPAFSYDPGAGPDLATRFSLENNPQPELDWPVERLNYADQDLQSVTEEVAFTFADFAVCDPRYGHHFDLAPRAAWGEGMVAAQAWLERTPHGPSTGVPYVLAVDDGDLLCRLVVDERLMRTASRCREAWHRLQELGGIHDSRAERMLARERQAWAEARRHDAEAVPAATPAAGAKDGAAPAADAAPAATGSESARNPDEPCIETIRCSSCNECTQVNPRMFAYNENKQAYIADLKAGTYRQIVEAAESCQLSIIHPGKPWDPDEPGLEDLLKRASPFL
jgi:ferredoxin